MVENKKNKEGVNELSIALGWLFLFITILLAAISNSVEPGKLWLKILVIIFNPFILLGLNEVIRENVALSLMIFSVGPFLSGIVFFYIIKYILRWLKA